MRRQRKSAVLFPLLAVLFAHRRGLITVHVWIVGLRREWVGSVDWAMHCLDENGCCTTRDRPEPQPHFQFHPFDSTAILLSIVRVDTLSLSLSLTLPFFYSLDSFFLSLELDFSSNQIANLLFRLSLLTHY